MANPFELSDQDCREWMKRLLKRAKSLGEQGEIPVTAVVLDKKGRCIGHGGNRRNQDLDPLGHAEICALKQASLIQKDWRFNDCTLLVTLEPCPMCAGALTQARMGQVIFGASDTKRGALGSTINLANHKSSHHKMIIRGGIMETEARELLQDWFKRHRRYFHEN